MMSIFARPADSSSGIKTMIQLNEEICRDPGSTLKREWLETNGLGGFASSTIAGLNTRRYHGLLVAAIAPPVGRTVLLSKVEETIVIDGRRHDLSANQYPGAIHPQGHTFLKQFRLDPFPVFVYEVEGVEIEKAVFMIEGENTVAIEYRAKSVEGRQVSMEVRPLVAFRDYHATMHENPSLRSHVHIESGMASIQPYDNLPALHFAHTRGEIEPTGYWYRNFEYEMERERGLDFTEDLFNPFVLKFDLNRKAAIIASTERRDIKRIDQYRSAEIERRRAIRESSPVDDYIVRSLVAAADQYIVARGEGKTVIAGYHWFSDWGRDTMIALPGLTLVTNRADITKQILLEFARWLDRGMLPNRFPDAGETPEYNTVDATLWFFEAVRALIAYTADYDFVRDNLYDALKDIIDWHERGTRYSIRVDADGLLYSGEEGVQLTWMDAKVGDWVVTPRRGKAVEIQSLWYNALRVMENLARHFDDGSNEKRFGEMARRAKRSFNQSFWNEEAGCLYDVIDGDARDASIRPNQIFAVSLHHSMLTAEKSRRVVEAVERHLLTPVGLRSLANDDAQYSGRYEGGVWERDSVYHQGTVWAWLMGPFITAYLRVNKSKQARGRALRWLEAFRLHLSDACLGQVSEIFDGDAPHTPRGCAAQAWSVAEILRAAVEDVFEIKPSSREKARESSAD
ncbi:MAG: amylo-alpha-1,6-glucosidase [Acidobacteriota bacterium]